MLLVVEQGLTLVIVSSIAAWYTIAVRHEI